MVDYAKQQNWNLFQKISYKGAVQGIDITKKTKESIDWFRNHAKNLRNVNRQSLMNEKDYLQGELNYWNIGSMYMFFYDPKWKDELPYYDTFPIIIPIEMYNDGFLGMNFHYLPPLLRAKLMNNLYDLRNNKKYDESTKILLSYKELAGVSKYREFVPTIHRYLNSHVRSHFLKVPPLYWDIALFLPVADFKKASIQKVYSDSRAKIRKTGL